MFGNKDFIGFRFAKSSLDHEKYKYMLEKKRIPSIKMIKLFIILLFVQIIVPSPMMRLSKNEFKYALVTILEAGLFPPGNGRFCFDVDTICSNPVLNGFQFVVDPEGCFQVTCSRKAAVIKKSKDKHCLNEELSSTIERRSCLKQQRDIVEDWFRFCRM